MTNSDIQHPRVYDPNPTTMRLEAYGRIDLNDIDAEQLATPASVKMLLLERKVAIADSQESRRELQSERERCDQLRQQVADLRVEIASDKNQVGNTWLEIPASIIAGAGAGMLIVNAGPVLAGVLLVIGILMILGIRQYSISKLVANARRPIEERKDA